MRDFEDGEIIFACDGDKCHEVVETFSNDWNEARKTLKEAGWRTLKDGDGWLHLCTDCKYDY